MFGQAEESIAGLTLGLNNYYETSVRADLL